MLSNASLVNKYYALFSFKKSESSLEIKAISEINKHKPISEQMNVISVLKDAEKTTENQSYLS